MFKERIENCPDLKSKQNIENMTNLSLLYGLCQLNEDAHSCYQSGYFTSSINYSTMILEAIKETNRRIRPQALNIIESIGLNDDTLCSAIGNSYGDIYETHLEWARNANIN